MKWDDEIKFIDTAKLTKNYNLKKKIDELREIRKQAIEKIASEITNL